MGVIVGTDVPMFIGAMVMGPFSGLVIKKFDKLIEGKVKAGFEMLVNNFSLGIIGAILAVVAMKGVTPLVTVMNNAINHGILFPLGVKQVEEIGKSIFFLLESNPGPGLGILLAYCIAGKGSAKSSAPGAVIIHFFGGIHEIYFPYILMNPLLLLSVIGGGAAGTFVFQVMGAGLKSPASPGSILAILALCEKHSYVAVLAGVAVAAIVSFVISVPILKFAGKEENLEESQAKIQAMKKASKGIKEEAAVAAPVAGKVKKIVFACDAGMGSSSQTIVIIFLDRCPQLRPLLMEKDMEAIEEKVSKYERMPVKQKEEDIFTRQLEQVNYVAVQIKGIIKNLLVMKVDNSITFSELLVAVSEKLSPYSDRKLMIQEDIIRREKLGTQVFAPFDFALLHTRTKGVVKPSFSVCLTKDLDSFSDSYFQGIHVIIVMLLPDDEHTKENSQILGYLSGMLIEDENFLNIIRKGEKEEIRDTLSRHLKKYFNQYLNKI